MHNKKIKEMMKDTTIAFSGFNMRFFAVLAIESFLLYYPELRKNIVYFDDNSTDKTVKDLERRGIKVISWSKESEKSFNKLLEKDYFWSVTQNLSTRVSFMMNDIMKQVDTRYLLINDGDVIFKKGDFLEKYLEEMLDEKIKMVFHEEESIYKNEARLVLEKEAEKGNFLKDLQYYQKYERYIENKDRWVSKRFHYLHSLVDLTYLKENDLIGDRLNKRNTNMMHGGVVDTGTDFYYRIKENIVPYKTISHDDVFNVLYHFGWISSSNRDILSDNENSERNQVEEIKSIFSQSEIKNVLDKIDVRPKVLINAYIKSQKNKKLKT